MITPLAPQPACLTFITRFNTNTCWGQKPDIRPGDIRRIQIYSSALYPADISIRLWVLLPKFAACVYVHPPPPTVIYAIDGLSKRHKS